MSGSRSWNEWARIPVRRFPWAGYGPAAIVLLAGACATSPGGGPAAPVPEPESVAAVVDSVVSTPPLDRTHWGIEIYDPAARRTIYSLAAEKHFIPASNTKLVVTAVALGVLGPEYRYRTEIYASPASEGAAGSLVIVARGDPTMSRRFHPEGPSPLELLADSVVAAGISRVDGEVIVDATYFDQMSVHPAWEIGDLAYAYGAPTDAFAIDEGTFRVVIEPGTRGGEPAEVRALAPEGAVAVHGEVVTGGTGARRSLSVRRRYLSELIEIRGTVPLGASPDTLVVASLYPAELAAREFVAALEARGVEVGGGVRVVRDSSENAVRTEGARLIATWHSAPLSEIVAAILQPSQNWIAEQLLKTLGAERGEGGSWREGVEVERRYLIDEVGLDSTAFWLSDGSGLSPQNLLTPHAIVRLLDHARIRPWGTIYLRAMAQPGEIGTLEGRLIGLEGRVFAKTGTITHVNTLSGYLRAANGRELLFSILTNASGWPAAGVRQAIDRIVRAAADP